MTLQATLRDTPQLVTTLGPVARTATANGTSIDLASFRFSAIPVVVGTITDGPHILDVEEADDEGTGTPDTWANVAADDLQGTFATLASDTNQAAVYIGTKRWLRVNVTISGGPATGGVYTVAIEPQRALAQTP